MLVISFPTTKVNKDAKALAVAWNLKGKLAFRHLDNLSRSKPKHGDEAGEDEVAIMTERETNPSALEFGNRLALFTKGILCKDSPHEMEDICTYDPETGRIEAVSKGVLPVEFDNCFGWDRIQSFSNLFFNIIARASGLKIQRAVNQPTHLWTRMQTPECLKAPMDFMKNELRPKFLEDKVKANGLTLLDGQWCEFYDSKIREIESGDTVSSDRKPEEGIIFINEHQSFCRDDLFSFVQRDSCRPHYTYTSSVVNIPGKLGDKDLGTKLYDQASIQYDIYDNVTFKKDGSFDPISFVDGKHNFGVVLTKVVHLDVEKAMDLYTNNLLDQAKAEEGKTIYDCINEAVKDKDNRDDEFAYRHSLSAVVESAQLIIQFGDEELTDDILKRICNSYPAGHILDSILQPLGHTSVFRKLGKRIERPTTEVKLALLKDLMVTSEMYIPIVTPRLNEIVAADLNALVEKGEIDFPIQTHTCRTDLKVVARMRGGVDF